MSVASRSDPVAVELARRIVSFDVDRISEQAIESSRLAILDTVGVTLAGVNEASVRKLMAAISVSGESGPASILGTRLRASLLDAAMVNSTASHALDYDDFSQPMGGHQSVPLVCSLLALAEQEARSGLDLIRAYVIGIETEIRVARSVNFHHYDKGWHPTATIGIFGTVAACGYLLSLSQAQMATALAIATSMASGIKANFGTMVKPLHVGQCARNGLLAVLLAREGFDANTTAFEHKQGFFNVFNGAGNFNPDRIFEDWADPREVLGEQMGLKQFPSCGSAIPAVTMMLQLRKEEAFSLEDVQAIEILLHKRRLVHTDDPDPGTPMAAKFSAQYAVCRALVSHAVRIADFEGDAFHDPEVRAMMARSTTRAHPDMADDSPNQFGAEVRVTLNNGMVLSRKVDNLPGRGIHYPMTPAELWDKYSDCAQVSLPSACVKASFDRLLGLEKLRDIRELTALLRP